MTYHFPANPGRAGVRSFGRIRTDARQVRLAENTCIGCGCFDACACVHRYFANGPHGPCYWVRLELKSGRGVCSACPGTLERWDAGNRELRRDRT